MLNTARDKPEIIASPYPHIAVCDTLMNHDDLVHDFPAMERFGAQIRMHGDLTEGDAEYEKLIQESPAFKALHDWVYSAEAIGYFIELFDAEIEKRVKSGELLFDPRTLPIRPEPYEGRDTYRTLRSRAKDVFLFPRLDIGIGKLDYGRVNGGGGIHVDNLTRLVSILVYIDDNPTMVGGEHRLYRLEDKVPVIDKVYKPEPNFMVASLQTNHAYHDVNPITQITGLRKAIYVGVSCSVEIWKPHSDRSLQCLTKNRYRPTRLERAVKKSRSIVKRVKQAIGG